MEIATERIDDGVVVKAKGRFYSNDAQAVEAGLAEAIGTATLKQIQRAKGKVVLFGLRPNVREVFSITAFDRIFSIHVDRAAAVAAMQ